MALDLKETKKLLCASIEAETSNKKDYSFGEETLSCDKLKVAAASALKDIAVNYETLHDNGRKAFALIVEAIEEYLPQRVIDQYGQFAEIRTFKQGDRPVFYQRISSTSKRRARQFITKVGLAGRYEVFKLDGRSYEIPTSAFGGGVQVAFEEVLDGRITMADVLDIALESLDRALYIEIERALIAATDVLQASNKRSNNTFDQADFDELISIADSYGSGKSTIYCTFEFAATMIPNEGWVSENMKNEMWANGYLGNYKGHRVVVLNQSFEDETNTVKVVDPSKAYIFPAISEKPVKVAIEGQLQMRAHDNDDWSQEIEMYKKMGVAADFSNGVCVYTNTALTKELEP